MAATPRRRARRANDEGGIVIPLARERLRVGKETQQRTVRIEKKVRTRDVRLEQELTGDEVSIERVPVNRFVEGPVPDRREGDTLIVSVLEEVPVVLLRVREEIRITKKKVARRDARTVTLRSEEASVQRSPARRRETGGDR